MSHFTNMKEVCNWLHKLMGANYQDLLKADIFRLDMCIDLDIPFELAFSAVRCRHCSFDWVDEIKKVLTLEQMRLLLEKAQEMDHFCYPIWACALYTGCRNGELYAITRDKVDLENRSILISTSWDHKHGFKEYTKSKQDRIIEIAPPLVPILKKLYAEEPESTFVLPHHRERSEVRQAEVLRTFLMGIGLPPVRFHDLRASFATALLGQGVEPAKVMCMGGWSDLKTMEIYLRKAGISIRE